MDGAKHTTDTSEALDKKFVGFLKNKNNLKAQRISVLWVLILFHNQENEKKTESLNNSSL